MGLGERNKMKITKLFSTITKPPSNQLMWQQVGYIACWLFKSFSMSNHFSKVLVSQHQAA